MQCSPKSNVILVVIMCASLWVRSVKHIAVSLLFLSLSLCLPLSPLKLFSSPILALPILLISFFPSSLSSLLSGLPLSQYLSIKKPTLLNTANTNSRLKILSFSLSCALSSRGDRWKASWKETLLAMWPLFLKLFENHQKRWWETKLFSGMLFSSVAHYTT